MSGEDQSAFDGLLQQVEKHSSISYLAPRQSPFDQLLLTIMIEIQKKLRNSGLKYGGNGWLRTRLT
jgi:hypothetical protein